MGTNEEPEGSSHASREPRILIGVWGGGILIAAAIPRLPYYAQGLMGRLPFRIDRSFRRYQRRLLSVPYAPLQLPNF